MAPGEKLSSYWGGHRRQEWHRSTPGTPNSSKYQRGEEKNQQQGGQILWSPIYTAPDPDKSSFLWEEWPEKQVT